MAEDIIFKVSVDTGDAKSDVDKVGDSIENVGKEAKKTSGSFTSLRKELKDLTIQLQNLDPASKEFEQVAKRAGQIKEQMRGVADAINDADPEVFGGKFQRTAEGIAGAFSAVTGAQALFGQQSEEIEKQMLKVQGAIALTQGISSMKELRNDAADLFNAVKVGGVNAFKALQKAIGSTGIGLLVVALGTLVAYWDDIKRAISGVSSEQEKLNVKAQQNLKLQDLKKQSLNDQDNILKLQGKSEKEILNIKIKQTNEQIAAYEVSIEQQENTLKAQIQAAKRNREILKGLLDLIQAPITAILTTVDLVGKALGKDFGLKEKLLTWESQFFIDPKEVQAEGDKVIYEQRVALKKLKNERAGYILESKEIDKKASEEKLNNQKSDGKKTVKTQEEIDKERLELQRKIQDLLNANIEDANLRELAILKTKHQRELEEIQKQYGKKEEFATLEKELKKQQQKELDKLEEEQKKVKDEKEKEDKNKALEDQKASIQAEIINSAENFKLKQEKQIELENADYEQRKLNAEGNKAQLALIEAEHAQKIKDINKESVEYQKQLDQELVDAKNFLVEQTSNMFGQLANASEQGSKIQKAFAIAQLTVDTAKSISSTIAGATAAAASTGPAAPFVLAGYIAQGIATVTMAMNSAKKILNAPMPSVNAPSMPRPNQQQEGATNTTQQQQITAQSTYKVVVLDSDITKMQEKSKKTQVISTI